MSLELIDWPKNAWKFNVISTWVLPRFVLPLFSVLDGSRVPNTSFWKSVPQSSRSRWESLWEWVGAGNFIGVWKIQRTHENQKFSTIMRQMIWMLWMKFETHYFAICRNAYIPDLHKLNWVPWMLRQSYWSLYRNSFEHCPQIPWW